jgi:hypothetical protein
MRCYQCGSRFTQTITPYGKTEEMEEIKRATNLAIWWETLPTALKSLVTTLAALLGPLRSEGVKKYSPAMLRYDFDEEKIYIQPDEPEAETDVEDTGDDDRRLVIWDRGDGLSDSNE